MGAEKRSQQENFVDENIVQNSRCPTHRLLLAIVDATGRSQYGKSGKSSQRFFEKSTWNPRSVLLGETESNGSELAAKTTREVQSDLHLEDNGGTGAKLWFEVDKL